eukprot:Skav227260  [mRNA]  locus=scaffold3417:21309:29480:- [translate_table: standard]
MAPLRVVTVCSLLRLVHAQLTEACCNLGSSGAEYAQGVAVDATTGDVYLTASAEGGVNGESLVGETSSYGSPYDITLDSSNNPIVVGNHQGSFFGTAIGNRDIVVIQLNSAGVLQWAFQFGSTSQDQANCVTIDSSGNIIVGGYIRGTITGHTFQGGENDNVLIKLDSGGSQLWVMSETLSTSGTEWINDVITDSSAARLEELCFCVVKACDPDDIYFIGSTAGDFNGHTMIGGSYDAFVAKVDSAGSSFQWSDLIGTSADDRGTGITLNSDGDVFVTGGTYGGSFSGYTNNAASNSLDIYLAKLDPSTGTQAWLIQIMTSADTWEYVRGIIPSPSSSNVVIFGASGGDFAATNEGGLDYIVAEYDTTGAESWASQFDDTSANGVIDAAAFDSDGDLVQSNSGRHLRPKQRAQSQRRRLPRPQAAPAPARAHLRHLRPAALPAPRAPQAVQARHLQAAHLQAAHLLQAHLLQAHLLQANPQQAHLLQAHLLQTHFQAHRQSHPQAVLAAARAHLRQLPPAALPVLQVSQKVQLQALHLQVARLLGHQMSSSSDSSAAPINVSAAEARVLEAERKQEAEAAVARIQEVEESTVVDAIASLNDSNSEMTLSTGLGPMKLKLIKKDQVEAAGGALIVYTEDAVVELVTDTVSEVLTSAGLNSDDSLVMSVVQLNQENSSSLETDAVVGNASALSSPALSINFWTADGSRVDVKDLARPLYFTLEVSDPTARCGFWDEDIDKWSDEGLNTVPGNGIIECSTAHLTIFGAIRDVFLKNILLVLQCSTFSTLWTREAFERLQDPSWLESPSSILNIVFHVLGVVSIVLAWLYDRKQERLVPWEEREMVLFRDKAEEGQSTKKFRVTEMEEEGAPKTWSCWSRCMGCCNQSLEYVSHATGGDATVEALKEAVGNADTAAVNRAISTLQSHKSGIARSQISVFNQINNMEKIAESTENLQRQETNLTNWTKETKAVDDFRLRTKDEGQAAAEAFLQRGWLCRVATLWPASHPWAKATHFSMLAPVRVSVALLVLKITSAAALSAVFFSSGSPTPDADPECFPTKGSAEQIIQTFGVGLFTAILGDVIISILFSLQIKRVVFSETEWTEEKKRRQHLRWNIWTCIFWSVCFVYGAFCQLYISLFLSNVTGKDAASWLQSMGVTLLEDLVLKSFLAAVMLATVATLVLCCRPHASRLSSVSPMKCARPSWILVPNAARGPAEIEQRSASDGRSAVLCQAAVTWRWHQLQRLIEVLRL